MAVPYAWSVETGFRVRKGGRRKASQHAENAEGFTRDANQEHVSPQTAGPNSAAILARTGAAVNQKQVASSIPVLPLLCP